MHRIFYFPDRDEPLTAGARALCYSNFHGCFFAQAGDLERARQHLTLGHDQATIFHLTGTDGVLGDADTTQRANGRCQRFLSALDAFVASGGRVVWSVGADTRSDANRPDTGMKALRAALGSLAHLIHCSGFADAKAVQAELDLDWRKILVVPHGNYRPLMRQRPEISTATDRKAAPRQRLGLDDHQRLVVHVSSALPADGAQRLLACWQGAKPAEADLLLLGPFAESMPREEIAALKASGIHCQTDVRSVADLSVWVEAADLVLLPFEHGLTRAALMLAFSCGRPAVIPAAPELLELATPGREAMVYDPDGGDAALTACLDKALRLDQASLRTMGEHADARASSLSWRMLGRQLADGFLRVVAGGRAVISPVGSAAAKPGTIKPTLVS